MTAHHLKTWPQFFREVAAGRKTVEVREDDRGYAVGDTLCLSEWDPSTRLFTGPTEYRLITHILRGWGIREGYVAMSLGHLRALDKWTDPDEDAPDGRGSGG